jgi:hypothetical protein
LALESLAMKTSRRSFLKRSTAAFASLPTLSHSSHVKPKDAN